MKICELKIINIISYLIRINVFSFKKFLLIIIIIINLNHKIILLIIIRTQIFMTT